ncbi:hypothetical protein M1105_19685 [Limibaculum sp. FT325]|uniref:hypothetical protein n=1 Tax=Thermohalobaculum sediminis TaxID=2939436 RepID=UPI0020BD9B5C|nr:hypothetical protein [Limibaculum sediminis]MCL5779188.1 hypothetical protein [Limibaculum sediminis]
MFKKSAIALTLSMTLIPGYSVAGVSLGLCQLDGIVALTVGREVEWDFDPDAGINRAKITSELGDLDGHVANVRPHDNGQKVNLRFPGGKFHDSLEVIIMKTKWLSSVAAVGYVSIDGQYLADVLTPFTDSDCVVRN